jgi:ATP/maltotriose-dependent transcriptional regulator MalT
LANREDLAGEDLERLAVAAFLVGLDDDSARAWERAHVECTRAGDVDSAARCAAWLGLALLLRGEMAQASGWFASATRLVEEQGADGSAPALLALPEFFTALEGGDVDAASRLADDMFTKAQRSADDGVVALALLCRGEAALARRETVRGLQLLDEAMVVVTSRDVPPVPTGIVYCAVIDACMQLSDLRRAAEWTDALDRWCAAQPDLVPFRGQCLVHRAQILQARGDWPAAVDAAERACRRLAEPAHPALGLALYEQGELHRLRGKLREAELAYRAASEQGREPTPGIALLRLAQGRVDVALSTGRRMVEEGRARLDFPKVLAAYTEILLAAGDIDAARAVADELAGIAATTETPLLRATSGYASGSVLLAAGQPAAALAELRPAFVAWRDLDVAYEAARARVQIGLACRALGDDDAAELELGAARATFERLAAATDLARVLQLLDSPAARDASQLTEREREVLRLVASGMTNREIAAELHLSPHTVGRHLQNVFTKLGVSTRAAATAHAYEHGIL